MKSKSSKSQDERLVDSQLASTLTHSQMVMSNQISSSSVKSSAGDIAISYPSGSNDSHHVYMNQAIQEQYAQLIESLNGDISQLRKNVREEIRLREGEVQNLTHGFQTKVCYEMLLRLVKLTSITFASDFGFRTGIITCSRGFTKVNCAFK